MRTVSYFTMITYDYQSYKFLVFNFLGADFLLPKRECHCVNQPVLGPEISHHYCNHNSSENERKQRTNGFVLPLHYISTYVWEEFPVAHFFYENTIVFRASIFLFFSFEPIFLKYRFSKSTLLSTVSKKFHTRKVAF